MKKHWKRMSKKEYQVIKGMIAEGYKQIAIADKVGRAECTVSKVNTSENWADYSGTEPDQSSSEEENTSGDVAAALETTREALRINSELADSVKEIAEGFTELMEMLR